MSSFAFGSCLLLLAAVFGFVNHRWIRLPRSIGLLIVALVVSLSLLGVDRLAGGLGLRAKSIAAFASQDLPHVFLDGALAFLLFAGALNVDLGELRNYRWTVLALATVGVVLATVLFALGIWAAFAVAGQTIPLPWCFVLGAILAPTDPIAVSSLLRRVGLPTPLQAVVAGESLFNDGVAVVVFLTALRIAEGEGSGGAGQVLVAFMREALGGGVLGFLTGYVAYRAMRLVDEYNLELTISLALVTVTYSLAQWIGVSGPIAVVVAGILIGNHATRYAMSEQTRANVGMFWSLVDELLNALLFLLIGFAVLSVEPSQVSLAAMLLAVPLSLLVRLVSVSVPVVLLNFRAAHAARSIAVLTWGGLRGGISVALALTLPHNAVRGELLTVCYAIVVFTIVVQGLTMPRLIARLYRQGSPRAEGGHAHGHEA